MPDVCPFTVSCHVLSPIDARRNKLLSANSKSTRRLNRCRCVLSFRLCDMVHSEPSRYAASLSILNPHLIAALRRPRDNREYRSVTGARPFPQITGTASSINRPIVCKQRKARLAIQSHTLDLARSNSWRGACRGEYEYSLSGNVDRYWRATCHS